MPIENQHLHKNKVHRILAQSYLVYFVLFLIGFSLDTFFYAQGKPALGREIFTNPVMVLIGVIMLIIGPLLILSAQMTGYKLSKIKEKKTEHFFRGLYRYSRSPTHWGIFFLMFGFGILANAFFVIMFTIIAFFISKFFFLEKQERILEEKYGSHYAEYKKLVKF